MKFSLFFLPLFFASLLSAQPQTPPVRPPLNLHPNTTEPNPLLPPAPNAPDPYDPYERRTNNNPCTRALSPYGKNTAPPNAVCQRSGPYTLSPEFTEAQSEAMHFLNIVDNQVYWGAWLDAGGIMHDTISQEIWVAGMRAVRNHLGKVRARSFDAVQRVNSLPGGLLGDFVIIRYNTDFAYRSGASETVTLMLHPPIGIWKVICYNVKS